MIRLLSLASHWVGPLPAVQKPTESWCLILITVMLMAGFVASVRLSRKLPAQGVATTREAAGFVRCPTRKRGNP